VRQADGGEAALAALSPEIDVLLVDRRMPVVSGNEVVAAIEERGLDVRVAMVTAVEPDFDILDLGIDDYLVKPVTKAQICDVVDRLLAIAAYSERVQELSAKRVKRNVLTVEKSAEELRASEEFARLTDAIERLEADVEELAAGIEAESLQRYV
jgi:YesN/AraC family two-component response regulator